MTWRVGRKLGRTLYRDEVCVGMVDTPEIAAAIIEAMNGRALSPGAAPRWPCPHCGQPEPVHMEAPAETAQEVRRRMGWPELTDAQKQANLDHNLRRTPSAPTPTAEGRDEVAVCAKCTLPGERVRGCKSGGELRECARCSDLTAGRLSEPTETGEAPK